MGKSKKAGAKSGKAAAAAGPVCNCTDPYKCACGNRPERPSRGHKWDPETKAWGGKGHKQKGAAAGQASTVAPKDATVTTKLGKTQVAQWQKMPSALLAEVCKKQKRPPPKFKQLLSGSSKFKCRVIVQDPKRDADKDLFFVPAHPVPNEEQSQEEAALIALLHMTPDIPHERKLPEPYKTTWLAALEASKQQKKAGAGGGHKQKKEASGPSSAPPAPKSATATANTSLMAATSFVSASDRRKQQSEKQKDRKAKIRRHEAIRMANRDHPVFLSAKLRQQIQSILRGGSDLNDQDLDDDVDDTKRSNIQEYVEDRLRHEGFTRRQTRTAYQKVGSDGDDDDESKWEQCYEECLQWLCVHLDKDDLPEGFDTQGELFEVDSGAANTSNQAYDEETIRFASKFGLEIADAAWIQQKESGVLTMETFWSTICELAEISFPTPEEEPDEDENRQALADELEALGAIFATGCKVETNGGNRKTISIDDAEQKLTLHMTVAEGVYPTEFPSRIWITGAGWPAKVGAAAHVALLREVSSSIMGGEPMIFEIYGHMQTVLQSYDELEPITLAPTSKPPTLPQSTKQKSKSSASKPSQPKQQQKPRTAPHRPPRHPRERSAFWTVLPKNTTPADPNPSTVSKDIQFTRRNLPAGKAKEEFLTALHKANDSCRVMLVTGDTGCGKTTQIPQFILEEDPKNVKIVVAQPRRLAATGVANRVANERGEAQPGKGSVGYVVRGDSAVCDKTRLLFCTTGVLLRQLQCDGALDAITHIVIDEVHERNLDGDVLMGLLKKLLKTTPHLKVVLMSATLDADRFAAYWSNNTPRMHIPGRTFPVTDYLLEDVLSMTGWIPPKKRKKFFGGGNNYQQRPRTSSPWADSEQSDEEDDQDESKIEEEDDPASAPANKSSHNTPPMDVMIKRIDQTRVDYELLGQLVKHLVRTRSNKDDGSILVFLPGAPEINQALKVIGQIAHGLPMLLLPLHGGLQPKEQNAVFRPSPTGMVKVILSTNVAETSITIPDCTQVIDSCREKQSSYDPTNRMPLLLEQFASKASLKQRRGRAGRVREGKCYKLISRSTHDGLREHSAPEITRCALDQTLLSLLFLGVEKGNNSFLSTLLDPPSKKSVDAATFSLVKLGAVDYDSGSGSVTLTPLGMHLAGIPAPPVVGKLLVMGSILGCRRAALAMAAGISVGRSPFLKIDTRRKHGGSEREAIEKMKQKNMLDERAKLFKEVGNSDHAMLAAVFLNYEDCPAGGVARKRFCDSLGLSFNGMRDMLQLANQLDSSLRSAGYGQSVDSERNAKSWRVLRTVAISAMAPGQLVKVKRPATKYVDTAEGALEKDGEAKELKFFIRPEELNESTKSSHENNLKEERVFIHPSSSNFSIGNYSCPWLVYHSMVRTSKSFLRDATECSAYALLLFGGALDVQARNGVIEIDGWVRLSANARIGALIRGLRERMDDLFTQKISNPRLDVSSTPEMRLIVKLLQTDGLGS